MRALIRSGRLFDLLSASLLPAGLCCGILAQTSPSPTHLLGSAGLCLTLHQLAFLAGVFHPDTDFFFPSLRGRDFVTSPKGVVLRFDDGPHPHWTPAILDVLGEHNVRGFFMLIGNHACAHPDVTARMVREGHIIGNHTMTHPYHFVFLTPSQLDSEIGDANAILEQITGGRPVYFAPPMGHRTPWLRRALLRHGLSVVMWDVNTRDTRWSRARILENALSSTRRRSVILFHDGVLPGTRSSRAGTVAALRAILDHCRSEGIPILTPSSPSSPHA